jgi:hypothetical protein
MSVRRLESLPRAGACLALLSATAVAVAGTGGNVLLVANPAPDLGDLFGASVAAVGEDKILIGAPGEDAKSTNTGAAYLFGLDGTPLQTFYSPLQVFEEFFGTHVTAVGTDSVLISATQPEDIKPSRAGAAYLFTLDGELLDTFANPDPDIDDKFGPSAALDANTIVIGSPGDDVNGADAGRAFVFDLYGKAPTLVLTPPKPAAGDQFGRIVAALGPDRVAVAAPGALGGYGQVHIFQVPEGYHLATLEHPDPGFEFVDSLAGYGANKLLVGSEHADADVGAVFLFDIETEELELTIPNPDPEFGDAFGYSLAVLGSGTIAVGADLDNPGQVEDAGTVYLYDGSGTLLDTLNKPAPEDFDQFGYALAAIGCNTLLIGTPQADDIYEPVGPGEAWVYSQLAGDCQANFVNLTLVRVDDPPHPEEQFALYVLVMIPDVADVTGVSILTSGELFLELEDRGGGGWFGDDRFFDLEGMKYALDGVWTITISGASPSTSTFIFDTYSLMDSDFYAVPTGVSPANGSLDVPLEVVFSWEDPTGKQTADYLSVATRPQDNPSLEQTDDSLSGTLSITDTSWDPPLLLVPGPSEFGVAYMDFDDVELVDSLMVTSGSITWGNSPIAPDGYPDATPLLSLGSLTISHFDVATGEIDFDPPEEFPAEGEAIREATGDLDGNGTIDVVVVIPNPDPLVEGTVQVFLNQGTDEAGEWLGFVANPPITVGRDPSSVATGLFNGDPHLDIAVTNAGDDNVSILLNRGTGDGTFDPAPNVPVGDAPSGVTTLQFNDDPHLDLAVTNEGEDTLYILLGDGAGGFSLPPGAGRAGFSLQSSPVGLLADDFDNNDEPDAAGPGHAAGLRQNGVVFVLLGRPGGDFDPVALYEVGPGPRDITSGYLNEDEFKDIAAVNAEAGTVSILLNLGDGTFAPAFEVPVGEMPRAIEAADVDGDSDDDLAVAADDPGIGPSVQVLANRTGDGVPAGGGGVVFDPPVAFGVNAYPNFVVAADLNGDGLPDLLTANDDDGPSGGSVTALISHPLTFGCAGDLDGDGYVNFIDLLLLLEAWGSCPPAPEPCPADLDGDGTVGILDLLTMLYLFGPCPGADTCPWDLDGDGIVGTPDLVEVLKHFGPCDDPGNCPWDFDGDGYVGILDLLELLMHFGPCP